MPSQQRRGYLALVGSAFLFGAATPLAVYALRALTAFDLLAVEIGSATLTLWAALAVRGPRRSRRWPAYAALGLLEPGLSYVFYNLGLARTSASHGALLESLDGLFTVVLAALLLRERVRPAIALSLLLGLVGAGLVATVEGASGPDRSTRPGDALVVAGVAVASLYSIAARRLGGGEPALTVTAYQFLAASALALPVALAAGLTRGSGLAGAGPDHLAAALGSGVLGTAAAYLLFNHGIARVAAGRAALVLNLIPVFGTAAAVIGLGETLHTLELAGAALIVAGVFVLSLAGGPDDPEPAAPRPCARTSALALRWKATKDGRHAPTGG